MNKLNPEVTQFLDGQNHPLRAEIEKLRSILLTADGSVRENIKWNSPNYCAGEEDRITMRVQPPKQIQLIFHRGAKKQTQPENRLIEDASGLLAWKENDRAVVTLRSMAEVENAAGGLSEIVKKWIRAAK